MNKIIIYIISPIIQFKNIYKLYNEVTLYSNTKVSKLSKTKN